ncbi:MAG: SapC family protein [Acidobacteriota bacterium]|jgi:hypothetical protein
MTKQLLIYEKAAPVTTTNHGSLSIRRAKGYGFARDINSVPLTTVEFANSASDYTIVFTGEGDEIMPAVVLGLRDKENLYLQEDGTWNSRYVPAFVRRYPFVFARAADGKTFTLCIDESFEGLNTDGKGERLFDADGEQTQYLKGVLAFLQDYQAQFERTKRFCRKLSELNLLEPMQAMFTLGSGEQGSLAGFMGVERERLKALTTEQLAELASTDALELAYLQLHSLRNLTALANRMTPREAAAASQEVTAVPSPEPEAAPSQEETAAPVGAGSD